VENRIKEICLEKDITFRYIVSDQNPSDLATRGLSVRDIDNTPLWWHGPSWLQVKECLWPTWNLSDITPEVLSQVNSEAKGQKPLIEISNVAGADRNEVSSFLGINEENFSSLRRLLRVTVLVLRFIKQMVWSRIKERRSKQKLLISVFDNLREKEPITSQETRMVSLLWVSFVQHKQFGDVYAAIENRRKHCLKMQLGLEIDDFGILRCHGRYLNSNLTEEMKYPKLLPHQEYFMQFVIQEVHRL